MGERNYEYSTTQGSTSYATRTSGATSTTNHPRGTGQSQDVANILSQLSLNSLRPPTNVLNSLDPSEYLLLLTPYLHAPPPHLANLAVPMDPFEPFGRDLSQHHANIRHVPYVAKHGMIQIHKQLLEGTGGVLVVICEPPTMPNVSSKQRLDGLKYQQRFARKVTEYLEELEEEIPSVLVTIDVESIKHNYDEAVELADWEELEDAADEIFGEN